MPVRPYLGESAEARVLARRARLLDAARACATSEGLRDVTIEQLCLEAKLNKRYFYESFASIDEVVAALVDTIASELVALAFDVAQAAREVEKPTPVLAREVLRAVVTYLTDDARRARILFAERAESPRAIAHRRATVRALSAALSAYGHAHHGAEGAYPISDLASALLVGGSIESIARWLDGDIAMSRDQLIEELAALWVLVGEGAVAHERARATSKR